MGMNYYLRYNICPTCGRYDEKHIGKSSYGWCFGLHIYPEEEVETLEDWVAVLKADGAEIYNEDGEEVKFKDLLDTIVNRSHPQPTSAEWLADNAGVPGPNNLARHKIDGHFCVGHGKGTWDYLIGEFS